MRAPLKQSSRAQNASGASIPAPIGGWDAISALEEMPPNRAPVLDNWFPSTADVRVRRGNASFATGMGTGPVESLLDYNGITATASKLFGAANNIIYDITAGGAGSSSVSSLTNNRWQHVNFATAGGNFLVTVNGADAVRNFDGTTWTSPTITGSGITSANFIHVNIHKSRLWFIIKNSTDAAYLPVNSIAGTAVKFPLGSLCTKGGFLVAMATWTRDGGLGPDDYAVFITSLGQVIVYQGTDPATAATWSLVGSYDVGSPIGSRCFTKVAGDVALVNIDGVLPLSKAIMTDRGASQEIAITANINNAMNDAARSYKANFGWELCPYPRGVMALVNVPIAAGSLQHQYVMNTLTGAWCRFVGMNANCWAVFKDNLYFGGNAGVVYHADTGGADNGSPIDAIGNTAYNYFKSRGQLKNWNMVQPLLTTDSDGRPALGLSTDFKDNAVLGTPIVSTIPSALYDVALYDVDVYAIEDRTVADWTTISGIGQCASIHFRSSTNTTADSVMRLNGFNVLMERGGVL